MSSRFMAADRVAEQVWQLDRKEARLQQLQIKLDASPYFDDEDVALVQTQLELVKQKLSAIRASVSKADVVYMLVTLKHREAFLEDAVTNDLIAPDLDKQVLQTFVKRQVYLTRLAESRCDVSYSE